jgi:hypothetical protein
MRVRRKARGVRPFRDNGRTGFTFYDGSEATRRFFHWYSSQVLSLGKARVKKEKAVNGAQAAGQQTVNGL